nr:MAG TPA: hypothetical protein [Caudoviricetes sp.]
MLASILRSRGFSFKRNLSIPEKLIPLSRIYNCSQPFISISLL